MLIVDRVRSLSRTAILLGALLLLAPSAPISAGELEDRHKETVRRWVKALNERRFDDLEELAHTDLVRHSGATPGLAVTSLEQMKEFLRADAAAIPDSVQTVQTMVAEGDRVAIQATYSGTQTGAMGPFPASGKRVEVPFLAILRFEEGRIAEIWVEWDNLSMLTQLGHLSSPG